MAVNPCKECGGPVSDKAESCPQCGAKQPKKTSKLALIFAGLVLLLICSIPAFFYSILLNTPFNFASTPRLSKSFSVNVNVFLKAVLISVGSNSDVVC